MNGKEVMRGYVSGKVRIFEESDPSNVLYEDHNLIVNGTSWLFSSLMMNNAIVSSGVWGLVIGSGDSAWDTNVVLPDETVYSLIDTSPLRLPFNNKQYVDSTGLVAQWSPTIDFQTNVSTTLIPALQGKPIRELGLIGGGITGTGGTDFSQAPFFDPSNPTQPTPNPPNSVILINIKRFSQIILPDNINFVISWQLAF